MEASKEVSRVVMDADPAVGLQAFTGGEKPLVVIGPEAPLVQGLADELREKGYPVFGVGKEAAQYEASKSKATKMAREAGVLHPDTFIAEGQGMKQAALEYIEAHDPQGYVIKADGLAGGKGVVLPDSLKEARDTVEGMSSGALFDGAGKYIINFQKRHRGPEVSAMVVVGAGKDDFVILPLSQDHKRLQDGDKGPNTGGMGAYAPVPRSIVTPTQYQKIHDKAYASLAGMEREGIRYQRAVLYMGLMMAEGLPEASKDDSILIEYNVRFGDPETQVILPLLTHAGVDVYRLLRSAAEGRLEKPKLDLEAIGYGALTVCLASAGYPASPQKGDPIHGLDKTYKDVVLQLAGTKQAGEQVLTAGGRVLYITGLGKTITEAATAAYAAIGEEGIHFAGMQYRRDIGWQAREHA